MNPFSPKGHETPHYHEIKVETWAFDGKPAECRLTFPNDIGVGHLLQATEELLRETAKRCSKLPNSLEKVAALLVQNIRESEKKAI